MDFETAFEQTKTKKYFEGYYHYYKSIIGNDSVNSVLEIGVQDGASLFSWRKMWPDADIEGIDCIEPSFNVRKNFKIYTHDSGNSNNANLLNKQYDLVVDDGDQNWRVKLRTFFNYYNKANKYYVIENIMGNYSLNKLFNNIPQLNLTDYYIFKSTGTKRTFSFRENNERIVENDSTPYILFIKVQDFTKQLINSSVYSESMLDVKENKLLDEIEICYEKSVAYRDFFINQGIIL